MANLIKMDTDIIRTSGDYTLYTKDTKGMHPFIPNEHKTAFFTADIITGEVKIMPFISECAHIDGNLFRLSCHGDYCHIMRKRMDDIIIQMPVTELDKLHYGDDIECLKNRVGLLKQYYGEHDAVSSNNTVTALTCVMTKSQIPALWDETEQKAYDAIQKIALAIDAEKGITDAIKKCREVLTEYGRFIWQADNESGIDTYTVNINATSAAKVWSKLFPSLRIDKYGKVNAKAPTKATFTYELILAIFEQLQKVKAEDGKLTAK